MKKVFVLMAIAAAMIATMSCKSKKGANDQLAPLNQAVLEDTTGTMLPFIAGFEEEYFCETAQGMLPSAQVLDSLSYLFGIQNGAEISYNYGSLNMDRVNKGLEDFKLVGFKSFDEAARANFPDDNSVASHFEVSPALINELNQHYYAAKRDSSITATLRDSMSYMFGIVIGYNFGVLNINEPRYRKGLDRFFEVDLNDEFLKFSQSNFSDSLYADYAAKYEIAPDLFRPVLSRYQAAKQEALLENVKIQSRLFLAEAAKNANFERKDVAYEEMVDTTAVTKHADLIYRFTSRAENTPQVEYGDTMTVTYCGRHIDYSIFDQGQFPVNGLQEQGFVKGFTEALLMMHEGDEIEIAFPYQLGYGEEGRQNWWSGEYTIYPCETLVFTLSVSDLKKAAAVEAEEVTSVDWE